MRTARTCSSVFPSVFVRLISKLEAIRRHGLIRSLHVSINFFPHRFGSACQIARPFTCNASVSAIVVGDDAFEIAADEVYSGRTSSVDFDLRDDSRRERSYKFDAVGLIQ